MNPINKTVHDFKHFIQWLFGKDVQKSMPGNGRGFRRKTSKFWEIWPMPPKIERLYMWMGFICPEKLVF